MMTEDEVLTALRVRHDGVTGPFKTHDNVTYFEIAGKPPLTIYDAREMLGDVEDGAGG